MRTLNIKSLFTRKYTPTLVFYLRVDDIVVYQINSSENKTVVDFEIIYAIESSLIDSFAKLLKQVLKHQKFDKNASIQMVIDDHYLTMHRFNFTDSQISDLHTSLDLEIDQLDDYEYSVEFIHSDLPNSKMVLIYLIKKSILYAIENTFKVEQLTLQSIISRYQAFNYLFDQGKFKLEPSKSSVMIDISQTRIRFYIAINGKVKMFRRMLIKHEEINFYGIKELDELIASITPFIESAIESYLLKYSNHKITEIYFVSDSVFLSPQNLKKYKIAKCPIHLLPIEPYLFDFEQVTRKVTFLFAYALFKLNSSNIISFNLIPVKYRLEKKLKFAFLIIALVSFLLISFVQGARYVSLKGQYNSFVTNRSDQVSENIKKRREVVELRDRINQQKKIIDYADLTTSALKDDIRIDKFLFYLVNITTPDIEFKSVTVRNNNANIFGFSDPSNGNYSFFYFLQQLEGVPNFDRVRYNLGLDSNSQRSTFSLEVFFKSDD